jgi:hypothetical protein
MSYFNVILKFFPAGRGYRIRGFENSGYESNKKVLDPENPTMIKDPEIC